MWLKFLILNQVFLVVWKEWSKTILTNLIGISSFLDSNLNEKKTSRISRMIKIK